MLHVFANGGTTLYVSPLTWTELTWVVSQPDFRSALPADWQREARLRRWDRLDVRRAYLNGFWVALEQLLNQYGWEELPITQTTRALALAYIADFGLEPEDALHLATAHEGGVSDFASFDAAFRRVDGRALWNDRLHIISS